MAPIKAVLRSKLGKADTAKSLMELVDKFEVLSDVSRPGSSFGSDSDSESELRGLSPKYEHQQQPQSALPTLFRSPAAAAVAAAEAAAATAMTNEGEALTLQRLQLQFLSQLLYQQMQQPHAKQQPEQLEEQPLNLTFNPLKRPAPMCAQEDDEEQDPFGTECPVKRPCPMVAIATDTDPVIAAPVLAVPATLPGQRRRKRSYRLSDNEEIRAYQTAAPELFAWNGHKPMIHQFLLKLLNNPACASLIRWLDRDTRLFKVLLPGTVARLWQFIKGNRTDNYECFARGIRHSRDIGKFFEAHDFRKKKVYKFSEKALRPATAGDRHQPEQPQHQQLAHHQRHHHELSASKQLQHGERQQPDELHGSKSSDVLAKLKSALVVRQQQQQQQQQQLMKDEPIDDESPLVIADCDHL